MNNNFEDFVEHLIRLTTPDEAGVRRLPPERDLCAALDVSRATLREHLAMLENLGVLHRRQGHGSSIEASDASFIRTSFSLMRRLGYLSDDEVTRARELIEGAIAGEAARRVADADLDDLRRFATDIVRESSAGNDDAALDADLAFHNRLYEIVDNPILTMLNEGLSPVLREHVRSRRALAMRADPKKSDGPIVTDTVHQEVVDALASRDPERATAAMRKHFVDYELLTTNTATPGDLS
ncbi:FadR/GntR family transcriptional regulator [Diaminobutyricimonas sp. LJ205]|uniref:FadR/GntR family transcriptional regulator n=1 Tax=Diaminobutyricimonas sp. LJ205 TaxID=2683590 RepID=UPI0012F5006A|nr:FCD domain-containing protein [Diaminobutyricimonas sp. LJ205]